MWKKIKDELEDTFLGLALPLFMGVMGFGLGFVVLYAVVSTLWKVFNFF